MNTNDEFRNDLHNAKYLYEFLYVMCCKFQKTKKLGAWIHVDDIFEPCQQLYKDHFMKGIEIINNLMSKTL
jgi:hypothetical protein